MYTYKDFMKDALSKKETCYDHNGLQVNVLSARKKHALWTNIPVFPLTCIGGISHVRYDFQFTNHEVFSPSELYGWLALIAKYSNTQLDSNWTKNSYRIQPFWIREELHPQIFFGHQQSHFIIHPMNLQETKGYIQMLSSFLKFTWCVDEQSELRLKIPKDLFASLTPYIERLLTEGPGCYIVLPKWDFLWKDLKTDLKPYTYWAALLWEDLVQRNVCKL